MNVGRIVVGGVAVCIVVVTLATGPVGPFGVPAPETIENPGTGTATVEVVEKPEQVTLEPTDDGQDLVRIVVPAVAVDISNVTGNPILTYTMRLDGTGLSSQELTFLGEGEPGRLVVRIERPPAQPNRVENATEADLSLTLSGSEDVTLFERTVPVERP
jgi:hypothetical protein